MSLAWKESMSRAARAARITVPAKYLSVGPRHQTSPIDLYYQNTTDILRAAEPAFLAQHPTLGALMLVGVVSATENYIRDIYARFLSFCPMSQDAAAQQTVSLGTVFWHGGILLERGAFEHISFAGADNIRLTCKKYIGYDFKKNQQADVAMIEFDKVCELRHGIVHSGSVIAGKNALRLGLGKMEPHATITVGFSELQESLDVCTTLVVAINGELFQLAAQRWATTWRKHPTWRPQDANRRFRAIWMSFHSASDLATNQTPCPLSLIRCRNAIKREYNLA
jgi:hypothetical protein